MKRAESDVWLSSLARRRRSFVLLVALGFLCVFMLTVEVPFVIRSDPDGASPRDSDVMDLHGDEELRRSYLLESGDELKPVWNPLKLEISPFEGDSRHSSGGNGGGESRMVSSLGFDADTFRRNGGGKDELQKMSKVAWEVGKKVWRELEAGLVKIDEEVKIKNQSVEVCPHSVAVTGVEFVEKGNVMVLPCGLTLGSHITVVAKPRLAHSEKEPNIALVRDGEEVAVSQFMMELQGLKIVDGEDPPRILHLNPRLKGDWSGKPVIEQNTCYRMQWGSAQRCDGWESKADEETGNHIIS